jgi:hypothetical protein
MLCQLNPIDIEQVLQTTAPPPPFPPASDRAAWDRLRDTVGETHVNEIIAQAEEMAQQPVPALPATLYLECERTGQREGYQKPLGQRRLMLGSLTLAECLEAQGRFLDPLLDVAWAICEESSWAYPAHQFQLADKERPVLDLNAATTALELAELDLLLGDRLDPALGRRIRYEVDQRCLTPYLTRHDFWWLYNTYRRRTNNWSAVCNAGVVGAALYLESDKGRLAEIIAKAARSLDDYLATFDPDGGSSEGPGYWAYGFGYYVILAHLVEQRTEGRIRFLDGRLIRDIAQFPLRTLLSPGRQVNFSDASSNAAFPPGLLAFLARRLDLPDLMRFAREQPVRKAAQPLIGGLRALAWHPSPDPPGSFRLARHDWFRGMMWMIARFAPEDPNALVLAAKGGHNAEMHNHNDVGAFLAQIQGESVIADTGIGRYTRAYFSETRYDHFATSSRGHSVPIPNGCEQRAGEMYHAALLAHEVTDTGDRLELELKAAYPPEADLASLRRTIALNRTMPNGRVELSDEARFATAPGRLESVLITFGTAETGEDHVLLRGEQGALRVAFDPAAVAVRIEEEKAVDLAQGPTDIRRVIFSCPEPGIELSIRLWITPS